tara:strand:- start:5379 stop:5783 length:405 start_codon:yes stop_codon:yes gene_type:complete
MADTLTVTAAGGSMTATLVGAWELRAGSHDTTEWLDGAADVSYPGGGPGTFNASNSDGANGYDAAPKMAIITLGTVADSNTVTLSGGASAILGVFPANGTANSGQTLGSNHSGLVITLETSGTVTAGQLLVLYN